MPSAALRCTHRPRLPYPLIDSYVFLGRRVPREILVHPVAHERLPRVLIAEGLQRLPDSEQQRFPAIFRKLETCSLAGPGIPGLNGVVQASSRAHDWNSAVLQTVYLIKTARLVPRRHEEHIASRFDF